jgi:hypothetical protein
MLVTLVTSVKSILSSKFVGLIEGWSRDFPNFVPLYVDKLQTANSHIDEYLIKIKQVAEANVTGSLEALKTELNNFRVAFNVPISICEHTLSVPVPTNRQRADTYISKTSALIQSTVNLVKQTIYDVVYPTNELVFQKALQSVGTITKLFLQSLFEFQDCDAEKCLTNVSY